MWARRGAYMVLVVKPLGRPRHRWEDNVKVYLSLDGGTWSGSIWIRTGTGGGLL
jgi:hypothetical protein